MEEGAVITAVAPSGEEEDNQNGDSSSFLEVAASSATATTPAEEAPSADIENQRSRQLAASNPSVGILASRRKGKDDGEEDDGSTDSVFSFDSYETKRRIPLQFQSTTTITNNNNPNNNTIRSSIPFPSVNTQTPLDYISGDAAATIAMTENVCPCRCLFFTVKESICLVLSALGCAVFLAGLIVLCLYLEGSLFQN